MNKCEHYCRTIQRMCNSGDAMPADIWGGIVYTTRKNAGKAYTDSISTPCTLTQTLNDWWCRGATLAPNGCIYAAPYKHNIGVIKYDPSQNTYTTIPATYNMGGGVIAQFFGGVLAPNGNIYCPGCNSVGSILVIDTTTDTTRRIEYYSSGLGDALHGGTITPDGIIYFAPAASNYIIKFDPTTETTTWLDIGGSWGGSRCSGAIYAPNGYIYFVPNGLNYVIKLDPTDDSFTTFGNVTVDIGGAVLASNGVIYGMPYNGTSILKIDTNNDTVSTFGTFSSGGNKYIGGALSPNGYIYGIPSSNVGVLKLNPSDDTYTTLSDVFGNWAFSSNGVVAADGKIYAFPGSSKKILCIDPGSSVMTNFTEEQRESAYLNHL